MICQYIDDGGVYDDDDDGNGSDVDSDYKESYFKDDFTGLKKMDHRC